MLTENIFSRGYILLAIFLSYFKVIGYFVGNNLKHWSKLKRFFILNGLRLILVYYLLIFLFLFFNLEQVELTKRLRFEPLSSKSFIKYIDQTLDENEIELNLGFKFMDDNNPYLQRFQHILDCIKQKNVDIIASNMINWRLRVLNTSKINAFSIPNGLIFLTKGDSLLNDDQLSILLGHEISHTLISHKIEMISLNYFLNLILLPPLIIIWSTINIQQKAIAAHLLFTSIAMFYVTYYCRNLEIEADYIASLLSAKACYDVRQVPLLWKKLKQVNSHGLPARLRQVFSSHPSFETRESFAQSIVPQLIQFREFERCPKLEKLVEKEQIQNPTYNWLNTFYIISGIIKVKSL